MTPVSGIGTCAVGGITSRAPSPGASCTLHVHATYSWPDGVETTRYSRLRWHGYTAREAIAARVKRLRDAHATFRVEDGVIVIEADRGAFRMVERLRFTDDAEATA